MTAAPKRRWFRFSLRLLFLVVVLLGEFFAWWHAVDQRQQAERDRRRIVLEYQLANNYRTRAEFARAVAQWPGRDDIDRIKKDMMKDMMLGYEVTTDERLRAELMRKIEQLPDIHDRFKSMFTREIQNIDASISEQRRELKILGTKP